MFSSLCYEEYLQLSVWFEKKIMKEAATISAYNLHKL